jgi:hypothetical protein
MTSIAFSPNHDVFVTGEVNLFAKRTFSFNGTVTVECYSGKVLLLKTIFNTLLPFSKVKIEYQDLEETVAFSLNDNALEWGSNQLEIKHNWFSFLSKKLCTVYLNGEQLLNVYRKGLTLSFSEKPGNEIAFYLALFLVVHYSDLDGGD